jgi:hypothetical protein
MVAILVSRNDYPGSELAKGASSYGVSGSMSHVGGRIAISVVAYPIGRKAKARTIDCAPCVRDYL